MEQGRSSETDERCIQCVIYKKSNILHVKIHWVHVNRLQEIKCNLVWTKIGHCFTCMCTLHASAIYIKSNVLFSLYVLGPLLWLGAQYRSPRIRAELSVFVHSVFLLQFFFSMWRVYVKNVVASSPAGLLSCKSNWKVSPPWFVGCSHHFNFSGVFWMCLQIDAENKVGVKHRKTPVETHPSLHLCHRHLKHLISEAMPANLDLNLLKQWKIYKFGGLHQKINFNLMKRVQF